MTDILSALAALREKYPPPKQTFIAVNIDDLHVLIQQLRKAGWVTKRAGKRAIWLVFYPQEMRTTLTSYPIKEIYVDIARNVPRGTLLSVDKPEWHPTLIFGRKQETP